MEKSRIEQSLENEIRAAFPIAPMPASDRIVGASEPCYPTYIWEAYSLPTPWDQIKDSEVYQINGNLGALMLDGWIYYLPRFMTYCLARLDQPDEFVNVLLGYMTFYPLNLPKTSSKAQLAKFTKSKTRSEASKRHLDALLAALNQKQRNIVRKFFAAGIKNSLEAGYGAAYTSYWAQHLDESLDR